MVKADIRARFGARLHALRKKRGWTQIELGEYLGLDRGYVSDLERGKRNPTLVTLQFIAKGFGVTVSRLLSGL
jgi:transcriptional regulator with XRE-family HTH domain